MKKLNTLYWIFTGLFAAMMLLSSIPDILSVPQAKEMVSVHLGYPLYFLPFIGVAKFLGVIAILVPGYPRVKEWAFAGFVYDLIGAMYSAISVGDPVSNWIVIFLPVILLILAYVYHHKKLKAQSQGIVS